MRSDDRDSRARARQPDDGFAARPLVPLLPADSATDPVVLETWYAALANSVGVEVPHDLFALWLYPADGGIALLGPPALAQDDLQVPLPAPHVPPAQLRLLEEIVRDAGYGSSICVPIRFGNRDVGLLLAADLRPGQYSEQDALVLQDVALRLGPGFARLGRQWPSRGEPGDAHRRTAALLAELAESGAAPTPHAYCRRVSAALGRLVPHERLELLIPHIATRDWYRLGEQERGALWSDPTLVAGEREIDVPALLADLGRALIPDTWRDRERRGVSVGGVELRSVLAAALTVGDRPVGALVLGSTGPDFYRLEDLNVLLLAAPIVAARVDALVQAGRFDSLRAEMGAVEAVPSQLRRMAALLATTPQAGEAIHEFAAEATALLPFRRMRFAVRLSDPDRAAVLVPGETRALADLPQTPIGGTAMAKVIAGAMPNAVTGAPPDIDLLFPLRVSGQVVGAMILTADRPEHFTRAHLTLAQQVADLIAPYVDLLRRGALQPPPFVPGWKRTTDRSR